MTELLIRSFREADRQPLAVLWGRVFADDPPWNAPEVMIASKLAVDDDLLLVAGLGGELAGAIMAGYDGVRGWLYHLAVAPEQRRRGIGTKLVRGAEERLATRGCAKVNLQVRAANAAVVAFYATLGYRVEERVSMGRRLTPAG